MSVNTSSNSIQLSNNQQQTSSKSGKRGFKLSHQKLVLDIDVDGCSIDGYTELILQPQTRKLKQDKIRLNSRQSVVTKVLVNNVETTFTLSNYLECVVGNQDIKDLDTYQAYLKASYNASDEGELIIDIPQSVLFYETFNETIQFIPIIIRIYYNIINCENSSILKFIIPDKMNQPTRRSHMYTISQVDGARSWIPCCDQINEKCTWELELTTMAGLVVVATGQLLEKVSSVDEKKQTFIYRQEVPTSAAGIGCCVGPFEIYPDPHIRSVTHFCLPHRASDLHHAVAFFSHVFRYFEEYLGTTFPYSSYKQVFIDDSGKSSFATLSLFNSHLLHPPPIIDQTFETRTHIVDQLAKQWFHWYVGARHWSDMWLSFGLSTHLANVFLKKMFGNNDHRYRMCKEEEFVGAVDNGTQPPICNDHIMIPTEATTELIQRKSPLVISMIEKRISEDGLRKVLNSLLVSPTNEPIETNIPTKRFLKLIKTLTGNDLKQFSEKWIYGKGCPYLICGFYFNRKRHQTEFAIKQVFSKIEDKISSTLTIRINELDGTYEHIINFDDDLHEFDFPCHSRIRKSRKKKIKSEDGEEMEIDLTQKRESPLFHIRIDPEMEWIHRITFRQPEYMWIYQLELDRDVVAQSEALKGLATFVSPSSLRAVFKFFSCPKYYYRVRMEAALVIARLSVKETNYEGLDLLINYFKQQYYDQESKLLAENNFSDFSNYFIKKIVPQAVSLIKDSQGRTPIEGIDFLIDLLKDNDNSTNAYSDNYYIASVLVSLANVHTTNPQHITAIHNQLLRYLKFDQLYPCYHNTITSACLSSLSQLQAIKQIPLNLGQFLEYTDYKYFQDIRKTAFQCYYRLAYQNNNQNQLKTNIMHFLLDCFDKEKSPLIKQFLIGLIGSPPQNMDDRQYVYLFRDDVILIERLWNYLNSKVSCYDIILRNSLTRLYRYLFGTTTPQAIIHKKSKIRQQNQNIKKSSLNNNQKSNNINNSSSRSKHSSSSSSHHSSHHHSTSSSSSTLIKRKVPEEDDKVKVNEPIIITNIITKQVDNMDSPVNVGGESSSLSLSLINSTPSPLPNNINLLDEDDINFKEFLELRKHKKHRSSHHHHHSSSSSSHHHSSSSTTTSNREPSSNVIENIDRDVARDLSKELKKNPLLVNDDFDSIIDIDIEDDEDFKNDLHLIEDLELKSRKTKHSSSHRRDHHHSSSGGGSGSGSGSHRESGHGHRDSRERRDHHHSSGSSHRESSHRESSHRDSSHRESGHRDSSHRDSGHRESSSHREGHSRNSIEKKSTTSSTIIEQPKEKESKLVIPIKFKSNNDQHETVEHNINPLIKDSTPSTNNNPELKKKIIFKRPATTPTLTSDTLTPPLQSSEISITDNSPTTTTTTTPPAQPTTPPTFKPKMLLKINLGANKLTKEI